MTQFDADYYERGEATGKSLYTNYRWMPELTLPMVDAVVDYCGMQDGDTVLDYGCAKGYTVKAFRMKGFAAYGVDISEYAIANADPATAPFLHCIESVGDVRVPERGCYDWLFAKDVFEHVEFYDIGKTIERLAEICKRAFVVVPLGDGIDFWDADNAKDVTHKLALPLEWWEWELRDSWTTVEFSYRVPGIKDARYKKCPRGHGFYVCTND